MRHPLERPAGGLPGRHATLSAFMAVGLLSACAEKVKPDIKPCPCAGGYICCQSGVCARDQASCGAATRALSESVQGVWTGYLENFTPSADDAVKIAISVGPDGVLGGQVVIGKTPAPPPPQSPHGLWPPGLDPKAWPSPAVVAGFAYAIRNLTWEERRLKFGIARYEPWKAWCALQTSYPDEYPGFFRCDPLHSERVLKDEQGSCFALLGALCSLEPNCSPYRGECTTLAGRRDESGGPVIICCPCAAGTEPPGCPPDPACASPQLERTECPRVLCQPVGPANHGPGVCACDETGCVAPTEGENALYGFDVALQEDVGNGSVDMRTADESFLFNLHLTRTAR